MLIFVDDVYLNVDYIERVFLKEYNHQNCAIQIVSVNRLYGNVFKDDAECHKRFYEIVTQMNNYLANKK